MNSATEDFTDIRGSTPGPDFVSLRGTQSSVKRKARVQRFQKIAPLNLEKIKKEVEEAEKNETESHNDKKNVSEDTVLKDISNKTDCFTMYKTPMKICAIPTKATKDNDSFDLNFTALSLVTPMKKDVSSKQDNFSLQIKKASVPLKNQIAKFTVTPMKKEVSRLNQNYCTPQIKITSAPPNNPIVKFNSTPYSNNSECLKNGYQSASKQHVVSRIDEGEERLLKSPDKENEKSSKTENNLQGQCILCKFSFETMIVKGTEYIILSQLGRGGSSNVFEGFCPIDKRQVAIKCVSLSNNIETTGYINEVRLLEKLQHCDKIIKMYDYELLESEKKMIVVLEKGGEDLSTILKKLAAQSSHVPLHILLFYWMEMLYAVKQIHSQGIIHSDLKPANFLRSMSGLKLIDFGIASSVQTDMTSVLKVVPEGSCNYISPEALCQDSSSNLSGSGPGSYKVHFKSDVWSLGCILYQLVYRHTPFHHLRVLWKKLAYITNPNHVIEYPEADWVPPKIIKTMKECLRYDVKSRPSIDELIEEYESYGAIFEN